MDVILFFVLFSAPFISTVSIYVYFKKRNKLKKLYTKSPSVQTTKLSTTVKKDPLSDADFMVNPKVIRYIDQYQKSAHKEHIFGLPGKSLYETFGEKGKVGAECEINTARIINSLTSTHENIHIFHNVHINHEEWDIDHIVVTYDTIILIDSKKWAQNHTYSLKKDTHFPLGLKTEKDDTNFDGGNINMLVTLKRMRQLYPHHNIYGIISVESIGSTIEENIMYTKIGFLNQQHLTERLHYILNHNNTHETFHPRHYEKMLNELKTYCYDLEKYCKNIPKNTF